MEKGPFASWRAGLSRFPFPIILLGALRLWYWMRLYYGIGCASVIRSRIHFSRYYMTPLIERGLVARTDPGNPKSPMQEYKLA